MKTLAEREQEIQKAADAGRGKALADDINGYTANRLLKCEAKLQPDGSVIASFADKNLCITPIQENEWRLHGELPSGSGIITDHDKALDAILEFLE